MKKCLATSTTVRSGREASSTGEIITVTAKQSRTEVTKNGKRYQLDAETHIDILRQQVIRRLVLLENVVVYGAAGDRAAEEEAKETGRRMLETN